MNMLNQLKVIKINFFYKSRNEDKRNSRDKALKNNLTFEQQLNLQDVVRKVNKEKFIQGLKIY